jgi:catalase
MYKVLHASFSWRSIDADLQLAGGPSVLFDSVLVLLTSDAAQKLSMQPAAVGFVADAYSHLKVIGYLPSAQLLLNKAGALPDEGVVPIPSGTRAYLAQAAKGRIWAREPKVRPVY